MGMHKDMSSQFLSPRVLDFITSEKGNNNNMNKTVMYKNSISQSVLVMGL